MAVQMQSPSSVASSVKGPGGDATAPKKSALRGMGYDDQVAALTPGAPGAAAASGGKGGKDTAAATKREVTGKAWKKDVAKAEIAGAKHIDFAPVRFSASSPIRMLCGDQAGLDAFIGDYNGPAPLAGMQTLGAAARVESLAKTTGFRANEYDAVEGALGDLRGVMDGSQDTRQAASGALFGDKGKGVQGAMTAFRSAKAQCDAMSARLVAVQSKLEIKKLELAKKQAEGEVAALQAELQAKIDQITGLVKMVTEVGQALAAAYATGGTTMVSSLVLDAGGAGGKIVTTPTPTGKSAGEKATGAASKVAKDRANKEAPGLLGGVAGGIAKAFLGGEYDAKIGKLTAEIGTIDGAIASHVGKADAATLRGAQSGYTASFESMKLALQDYQETIHARRESYARIGEEADAASAAEAPKAPTGNRFEQVMMMYSAVRERALFGRELSKVVDGKPWFDDTAGWVDGAYAQADPMMEEIWASNLGIGESAQRDVKVVWPRMLANSGSLHKVSSLAPAWEGVESRWTELVSVVLRDGQRVLKY